MAFPAYLYFAEAATAPLPTDLQQWPSHALFSRARRYYWAGKGSLSVKMFRGGTARYRVGGGGQYAVEDGAYLLLNPGQTYSIEIESPTLVESFCLFFAPGFAETSARSVMARADSLLDEPFRALPPLPFVERMYSHDAGVSECLCRFRAALECDPARDILWLSERMHDVMTALLWSQNRERRFIQQFGDAAGIARPATREELYRRLCRARDYIAALYDQPLTLESIAQTACLSPNHLLRTFRAAFQATPHQYLTERRLLASRRLLAQTELTVTEVCFRVGFVSLGSFSRLFARHVGVSPDGYRKQSRIRIR